MKKFILQICCFGIFIGSLGVPGLYSSFAGENLLPKGMCIVQAKDAQRSTLFFSEIETKRISVPIKLVDNTSVWYTPNSIPQQSEPRLWSFSDPEQGTYMPNSDKWLVSEMIKLPFCQNEEHIRLCFREWFEIESGYDYGHVKISTDMGKSWITLDSRSGKKDWCQTAIDLTPYSGQVVKIGFNFQSDNSFQFPGWKVTNPDIRYLQPASLNASLVALNPQTFPFIYMNILVYSSKTDVLDASHFRVYENNALQNDYFKITPPQAGGGSRVADIVFLMDNSGSMSDEQNAVRNNVVDFVNNLLYSGVDFSLGLCRFGQHSFSGNPIIEESGQLTNNANYFKNTVWSRNCVDGKIEPGYDAIDRAAKHFSFRPGSQKVFIIITDEKPNQGSISLAQATSVCTSNSITLFALTITELKSYFQSITDVTNGEIFNIYSNFDTILNYISSLVSNNYLVQYKSSNPVADGTERHVEVRIQDGSEQTSVYGSYVPGSTPQIHRSTSTLALHNKSWAANSSLTFEVNVIDTQSPYVNSVKLYYKNSQAASYSFVNMTHVSGSLWRTTLSGSSVQPPGVDYYFTASDGNSTISDPSAFPSSQPYQIAVLPNYAPYIVHTPVLTAVGGADITISAQISDNTNYLSGQKLYYKRTGQLVYQSRIMSNAGETRYQARIPSSIITSDGVDYFIHAWDDFGTGSRHGNFDDPHHISISSGSGRIPMLIDPVVKKEGMGTSVWLNWDKVTNATSYSVQLDAHPGFGSPEFLQSGITLKRIQVKNLRYSTTYYWRVRSHSAKGVSEWSERRSFTTFAPQKIVIDAPDTYVRGYLSEGDQYYCDRKYIITGIPDLLQNLLWIKTNNDDSHFTSSSVLTFTLNQNATVYVCVDDRMSNEPGWLRSRFSSTFHYIHVDEKADPLHVWQATFSAGAHTLGGNMAAPAAGAESNYIVLVDFPVELIDPCDGKKEVGTTVWLNWEGKGGDKGFQVQVATDPLFTNIEITLDGVTDNRCKVDLGTPSKEYYWRVRTSNSAGPGAWSDVWSFTTMKMPPLVIHNPNDWVMVYLNKGDQYYIDRRYVVTAIPNSLNGLLWVKTQNTDRYLTSTSVFTFELKTQAMIYIAMDCRMTQVPNWLQDSFQKMNLQIGVDDKADPLQVWKGSFEPGVHTLGGNMAPEASGAKSNYIILFDLPQWTKVQSNDYDSSLYSTELPIDFNFEQNYPNPFNAQTKITYTLPSSQKVKLVVYDLAGRIVKVLVDGMQAAGEHQIVFNGEKLASGIYVYEIQTLTFQKGKKMILIK